MNFRKNLAGLNLPSVAENDSLRRVLKSRLGKIQTPSISEHSIYWQAEFFGLDRVTLFQDSPPTEQQQILQLVNQALLTEAYLIEKTGIAYMSKMALLAETTEERMLYALFSGDEVNHLAQIRPFLNAEPVNIDDSFLRFLADLVDSEDKSLLLFVIQVVLEGWGLSHYRHIAKHCSDRTLGEIFRGFLQDESRHHGAGVTLFNRQSLSVNSQANIVETLTLFLRMVKSGPQRIVGALAQIKGGLSPQQQVKIFTELDTETHSATRLNLLRSLMEKSGAGAIVAALNQQELFQPFPPEKCIF